MNRRTPLTRSTGLRRSKGLVAHQPLVRRSPITRSSPARASRSARQRAADRQARATKRVVWLRCGGYCEICGARLRGDAWELSHRRHDGMGGRGRDNVLPSNGLASCPGPRGCNQRLSDDHEFARRGRERGWLLEQWQDPATEPVVLYGRGWVVLDDEGGWTAATPREAA